MRTYLLSTSALATVFLVGALAVGATPAVAQSTTPTTSTAPNGSGTNTNGALPASTTTTTAPAQNTSSGGGVFTVTPNGITDPSGKPFVAKGLDVDAKDALQNLQGLQTTFPGLNMVRLVAVASAGDNAQTLQPIIDAYTQKGIVVEVEDHSDSADASWYTAIYNANKNNPYVWYETPNEPPASQTGQPQADIINALRAAGDKGPIGLQPVGGYDQSNVAGVLASTGTNNVYVTPHIYDSSTSSGDAASYVASEAQQGHSAGVGVIIDEFGNAMDGVTMDPLGNETIQAVEDAVNSGEIQGGVAWAAGNGYHPDGADSACADPTCSSATSTGMGPMMQSWLNGAPPTPVASNGSGSGGGTTTPVSGGSGAGTSTASNGNSGDTSGSPSGDTSTAPSTQTASNSSGQSSGNCSQPGATTTQADNTGQGSGGSPASTDTSGASGSQTAQDNSGGMSFTPASQATPISFVPAPCTQVADTSPTSGGSSGGNQGTTNAPPPTQVASNSNGPTGGGSNSSTTNAPTTDAGSTQVASNSNGSQNPLTVIQQNPQAWSQFSTVVENDLYPLFQWFMGMMGGSASAQPSQASQQGQTQSSSSPSGT